MLVGTSGGLTACSGSPKAVAPTQAQAQLLLNALAADVFAHKGVDYVAKLDPSAADAAFRQTQATDLVNLAGVPLASWAYRIASVSTDAAVIAAATKRLGSPALIAQVTLTYQLPSVDVLRSSHDLWLTFVRRHGTTYLAGDSDLASTGFASWVGPWRYGKLGVARGSHSFVLGPAGEIALLRDLAAEVDAAVPVVQSLVRPVVSSATWPGQVAVIVPFSADEFDALIGSGTSVTDVSAAAVTDGIDPVSYRAFGQRLVLNPVELAKLSQVGRNIVLRHEITHLATATITADVTPRWLVEGFADYVGNLGSGQPVAVAASELRTAVRAGKLPTALPANTAFTATGSALAQQYEQSWLACRYIASRIGQAGLVRFYGQVGESLEPGDVAVAAAMRELLHESVAAFTASWRSYVHTQLS